MEPKAPVLIPTEPMEHRMANSSVDNLAGALVFDKFVTKIVWLIILFFWWPMAGAPTWLETIRLITSAFTR